jgi:hypothetical protein
LHEDVLHKILRVAEWNIGKQHSMNQPPVLLVECAEGGAVAVTRGAYQRPAPPWVLFELQCRRQSA